MALQHESGTSTGVLDLLTKLADFIGANGQNTTVARNAAPGTITGRALERQVSLLFDTPGVHVHFQSNLGGLDGSPTNVNRLWFEPSTGLGAAGTSFDGHTGGYGADANLGRSGVALPAESASFGYRFFHDDGWLHIVLALAGGFYQHAFAGQLEAVGAHAHGFLTQGSCGTGASAENWDATSLTTPGVVMTHCSPAGFPGLGGNGWGSVRNHAGAWIPTNQLAQTIAGRAVNSFARTSSNSRYSGNPYGLAAPPPHHVEGTLVYVPSRCLWLEPHATLAGAENNMAPVGYVPGAVAISMETIAENAVIEIDGSDWWVAPTRTRKIEHRDRYQGVAYRLPDA